MSTLLQKTLKLAHDCEIPISQICAETGLKERWLYRLLNGDYNDPGVNKIERLNAYLTGLKKTA